MCVVFFLYSHAYLQRAHFVFQLVHFLSYRGLARGTGGTTRYCPVSPPLFRVCTIVFPILGSAQITFIAAHLLL